MEGGRRFDLPTPRTLSLVYGGSLVHVILLSQVGHAPGVFAASAGVSCALNSPTDRASSGIVFAGGSQNARLDGGLRDGR